MTPNYDWYYLLNLADFIETGLISREIVLNFPVLGLETILITSGELVSVVFDDVILPIGLNNKNPFYFDSHAVYYDSAGAVWLGILSGN